MAVNSALAIRRKSLAYVRRLFERAMAQRYRSNTGKLAISLARGSIDSLLENGRFIAEIAAILQDVVTISARVR